ncbi:MAG: ABC transporter permease [Acidobacteria bacterium]|nr:ABC transporter permease [Acidobacteriota bacterium]
MQTLKNDVVYGLRMLRKSPGFTLVAALTLALGIGANTAIFSMVDAMVLRLLPVPDAKQIMVLAHRQGNGDPDNQFSIPEYRQIVAQSPEVFSGVFGYEFGMDGLSVNGKADRLMTNYVTGNFFSALGITPLLGRFIVPGEGETPGADPVIVLSYGYWHRRFNGDPGIVGRKVLVDGKPLTVIGVTREDFHGAYPLVDCQAYLPLGMKVLEGSPADFMQQHQRDLATLARLRPDRTLEQARASLAVLAGRMAKENPEKEKELKLMVFPEPRARPNPDPQNVMLMISGLFLGLAVMLLLLACLNVANILLVRATIREGEMAIRAALGAARARLIRQLLTESVLLALLGALAGIALGRGASFLTSHLDLHTDLPVRLDFGFDWLVFAYAMGAALLTGIVVGIVPAFRASRGNVSGLLHQVGRGMVGGTHRLRSALVIAQVAGSLTLLIVAGLFFRSLTAVQHSDIGFDPHNVAVASMDPGEIGYNEAQGLQFYRALLDRASAIPGVQSAALASAIPLGYYNDAATLTIDGYTPGPNERPPHAMFTNISPGYFETLRIPLVGGRGFNSDDSNARPFVAIVNQAMAKLYWPNQSPLGRRFVMANDPKHSVEVVGIAKDSRTMGLTGPIGPQLYLPLEQHYNGGVGSLQTLLVRTAGDPARAVPEIEGLIRSLAPDLPVFDAQPMLRAIDTLNGLLMFEIGAVLAGALGALGLVLSVVGVYGVLSYAASQRTKEIGIRMALGAQPSSILAMVLRQGGVLVGVGLAIGLACALGASRLVGNFLAVSPMDPMTYAGVTLVLTMVALVACYLPARRTMQVDPMRALRHE